MLHDGTGNRRRRPAPDQIYDEQSSEYNSSSSSTIKIPSSRRRLNADQSASATFASSTQTTQTSMNTTTNSANTNVHGHQQQTQGKMSSPSLSSASSFTSTTTTTTPCVAASQQTSVPVILSPAAEEVCKVSIQSAVECAERLRTAGDYDQAINILERTYQYATTMVYPANQFNVSILHILWQIGRTYHVASNLPPAVTIFEQVLLEAQQLSQHDIVADCLFRLAHMMQHTGDFRSAETYYRDALHVAIAIHGTKYHMDVATILYNMGMLAHGQGNLLLAQGLYEEAIRIASNASSRETSTPSLSHAPDNPNADFIANALELVVQIIEETTGLSNDIGTDEEDDALLAAIVQHHENNALWEMFVNAHLIAMCEMYSKVDDSFCAAAA